MHPMNVGVIPHFDSRVLDLSVAKNVHVDLCEDYGLSNVLELRPRLRDDVLRPVVVGGAQHTDGKPIFLSKNHVYHDVIQYHYN